MAIAVIMPKQGQSVETCIITEWAKKKGETVKKGDVLFTYETDKASFETEAEGDGVLLDIFFNEGEEVPVLANVGVLGKPGEATEPFRPGVKTTIDNPQIAAGSNGENVSSPQTTAEMEIQSSDSKLKISPRARIMAEKLGVNLINIKGSGPNNRIIARDIESATRIAPTQGAIEARTMISEQRIINNYVSPTASILFSEGDSDVKKLSNVRKIIAKAMYESISNSAQLTHHMSADVRKLIALRNNVKAEKDKGSNLNITLNDMICFAVIRALEKYPEANSHFLGDNIRTFKKVHLGLAVDTPRGLMVPSIQNVDDLSLKGLSNRLREVADQCKKGSVNPEVLSSTAASFTVSNLGNYGVEIFTPIINLPQVAILGVNTIIQRPADLGNGAFGFIPVIGLSLTYDHRAIDGGPATLFLREIKNQIENFNETI